MLRVPRRAREGLADSVRDVGQRVGVAVPLREPEVDAVAEFARVGAHDEVRGLDVAVDEVTCVDGVDALEQLVRQLERRLEREAPPAPREEVLQ